MATNGKLSADPSMLLAAIEQAKQELREEFDQDITALGAAVFGTTDSTGRLLKPGMVHMFNALDNTIAMLCERSNITPKDINDWLNEKAALASVEPEKKVTL